MRIKQSVCFPMVKPRSLSLDALCEAAAGIGYPAVELWYRNEDFEDYGGNRPPPQPGGGHRCRVTGA